MVTSADHGDRRTGDRAAGGLPKLARRIATFRTGARLRAFARDPLFAFLIIGGGLFAGYHVIELNRRQPVHYGRDIENALVQDFETVAGRKATAVDKARLRKDYITDELLFREAIDRGMHLTDSQTRKQLTDKARYLLAGAPAEPSEEQLINYYSEQLKRYQAEPKITFQQIFFDTAPADPAAILAKLDQGENVRGGDFWLGRNFPGYGESMVRGIFGQPFVERLRKAPQGTWFGPVRSSRGWHFVRKDAITGSALIPYSEVRDQVRQDFMITQTNSAIDAEVARLMRKYDVQIDR